MSLPSKRSRNAPEYYINDSASSATAKKPKAKKNEKSNKEDCHPNTGGKQKNPRPPKTSRPKSKKEIESTPAYKCLVSSYPYSSKQKAALLLPLRTVDVDELVTAKSSDEHKARLKKVLEDVNRTSYKQKNRDQNAWPEHAAAFLLVRIHDLCAEDHQDLPPVITKIVEAVSALNPDDAFSWQNLEGIKETRAYDYLRSKSWPISGAEKIRLLASVFKSDVDQLVGEESSDVLKAQLGRVKAGLGLNRNTNNSITVYWTLPTAAYFLVRIHDICKGHQGLNPAIVAIIDLVTEYNRIETPLLLRERADKKFVETSQYTNEDREEIVRAWATHGKANSALMADTSFHFSCYSDSSTAEKKKGDVKNMGQQYEIVLGSAGLKGTSAYPTIRSSNRWTEEEHDRFLYGVMQFGFGDWTSVAKVVVSKTNIQVGDHAQRFFGDWRQDH